MNAAALHLPDTIEHLPIEALVPYARNSRTHSEAQVAQLAASMREFGFTNPVLVDAGGGIVAGHGRVMAARSIGLQRVPCIRLGHLSEAQRRAYVIADNRLAEQAGWDRDMLALELRELGELDFDLDLTGFGHDEVAELLASADIVTKPGADPDAVIELSPTYADVIVKRWQEFAGGAATLYGDGRSFAEMAEVR